MGSIARNSCLFHGRETCLVPKHNVSELGKKTYYHIGVMLAVSLIHGGPPPSFFAPAIADYLAYGIEKVKATPEHVPDQNMRNKLQKVGTLLHVLVASP